MARSMKRAWLYDGMTTETRGLVPGRRDAAWVIAGELLWSASSPERQAGFAWVRGWRERAAMSEPHRRLALEMSDDGGHDGLAWCDGRLSIDTRPAWLGAPSGMFEP